MNCNILKHWNGWRPNEWGNNCDHLTQQQDIISPQILWMINFALNRINSMIKMNRNAKSAYGNHWIVAMQSNIIRSHFCYHFSEMRSILQFINLFLVYERSVVRVTLVCLFIFLIDFEPATLNTDYALKVENYYRLLSTQM